MCIRDRGWIDALPVINIGGLLSLDEFCICSALKMGADICSRWRGHRGGPHDPSGFLSLSCDLNVGCSICQVKLNLIIKWALAHINIPSVLETVRLSRSNGLTFFSVLEVGVSSGMQQSVILLLFPTS